MCICWQSLGGSFIPAEDCWANRPVALRVPKPASMLCPQPTSLSSASHSGGSIFLPTFLHAISSALNNLLSLLTWPSPGPPLGLSLSITSQIQTHLPVRGFHGTRYLSALTTAFEQILLGELMCPVPALPTGLCAPRRHRICLFCSLLCPQSLGQCLASSRRSPNVC